jgi:hypothetical protein
MTTSPDPQQFLRRKPRWLVMANAVVRRLDDLSTRPLFAAEPAELIWRAQSKTGLDDFGDESFREPLAILCRQMRAAPPLSAFGRLLLREDLTSRLVNRLRIQAYLADHPEVQDEQVAAPLFILGLPRTGTTLLHRLLATDPRNRALRAWEMADPIPPPDPGGLDTATRVLRASGFSKVLNYVAPNLKVAHEHDSTLPEECISLLANTLMTDWYGFALGGAYYQWLEQQDLTRAYESHAMMLKLFQSRQPGRRWVLKAPSHLLGLRWLLSAYPDAVILHIYRDPLEVLPSAASLYTLMRAAVYLDVDPAAVGAEVAAKLSTWLERGLAARDEEERRAGSRVQFVDVDYRLLVQQPLAVLPTIYERMNVELVPAVTRGFERFLAQNPQGKHGRHRYTLEQFGFDPATERRRFAAYGQRFDC